MASSLDPIQVQRYLLDVDGQLSALRDQLEPLLEEQSKLNERRSILYDLLASFGEEQAEKAGDSPEESRQLTTNVDRAPRIRSRSSKRRTVRERVHDEVVKILHTEGEPMHINDILERYVKHGFDPPGQGKPANISVHLSGWTDICSPQRGMYGLTDSTMTTSSES